MSDAQICARVASRLEKEAKQLLRAVYVDLVKVEELKAF